MSTGKAAKLIGVSVKTLQRWEREGRLIPVARTDSNRRLYTETQIREFIGLRLATGTALPVASPASNGGAVAERESLLQPGKLRLSETTAVIKTRRGRKRTVRTFCAHS